MFQVVLKRLRLNFLTARFWVGLVILLVLSVLSLLVGIREYEERTGLYEAERNADAARIHSPTIVTYAQTETVLHRSVQPLSLLSRGLGEQFGSVAYLRGLYGSPVISSRSRSNFLLPSLGQTDFTLFTHLFLALMAIFLTSDVIAGERHFGTLQLTLSNPLPRWKLLLGEYMGALTSLGLPTLLVLLIAVVLLMAHGIYDGSLEMTVQLGLLGLVYLLTVSVFVVLGLWISAVSQQPATALALGFFLWVALVAVYPNGAAWLVRQLVPLDRLPFVEASSTLTRTVGLSEPGESVPPTLLERYRNQNLSQAHAIDRLWLLFPFSNALSTSRAIVGTGVEAHEQFLSQVRRLDQNLADWQSEKVRQYPQRERRYVAGQGDLDLSGLPMGGFEARSWKQILGSAALPFCALVVWNLLSLLALQVTFFRYDVRSQ